MYIIRVDLHLYLVSCLLTKTMLKDDGENNSSVSQQETVQDQDRALAEKKLVRKLDTRLLPFLSFMYLFSSLDRSSLGELQYVHLAGLLFLTNEWL